MTVALASHYTVPKCKVSTSDLLVVLPEFSFDEKSLLTNPANLPVNHTISSIWQRTVSADEFFQ